MGLLCWNVFDDGADDSPRVGSNRRTFHKSRSLFEIPVAMTTLAAIKQLRAIGSRFSGLRLDDRRDISETWPKRYRLKLVCSKNRNRAFRITAWGDTLEAVVSEMSESIAREDATLKFL